MMTKRPKRQLVYIVELSDSSGDGELTTTELFKINVEVK